MPPSAVPLPWVDRAAFAVAFGARLRAAGLPVGVTAVEAFTRALGVVPPMSRGRLYWLARTTLARRHSELEVFDAVFAVVFDAAGPPLDPPSRRGARSPDDAHDQAWAPAAVAPTHAHDSGGLPWVTRPAVLDASPTAPTGPELADRLPTGLEALVDAPFNELDERQLAEVGAFLEEALPRWPVRRGRRRRVHPAGDRAALRATMARARRTGWEPLEIVTTRSVTRPRRVLMLCDVSRSMQPTTTAYLHLMRAAALRSPTEVFAFATRLTRLTPVLAHRSAERAVELATARVTDRFGGTRIAGNIAALLGSRHGSLLRGATVVIASDGWDADPPDRLDRAMARLRRRAHAVIWVNPRVAAPDYRPLVGGMAAALPHCDRLLPGHSLGTLFDVIDAVVEAG
jgi:uncharacterized protein with von Willebrand factor type A (vWA) domain